MNRVGDDVLAGAGLAEQDDREVALADEIDDAVELAHPVVDHDDRRAPVLAPRPDPGLRSRRRVALEGRPDDDHGRADGDDLPPLDAHPGASRDADARDRRPVGAPQVLDGHGVAPEEERVLPRDGGVIDAEVALARTADGQRRGGRELLDRRPAGPHGDQVRSRQRDMGVGVGPGDVVFVR